MRCSFLSQEDEVMDPTVDEGTKNIHAQEPISAQSTEENVKSILIQTIKNEEISNNFEKSYTGLPCYSRGLGSKNI